MPGHFYLWVSASPLSLKKEILSVVAGRPAEVNLSSQSKRSRFITEAAPMNLKQDTKIDLRPSKPTHLTDNDTEQRCLWQPALRLFKTLLLLSVRSTKLPEVQ